MPETPIQDNTPLTEFQTHQLRLHDKKLTDLDRTVSSLAKSVSTTSANIDALEANVDKLASDVSNLVRHQSEAFARSDTKGEERQQHTNERLDRLNHNLTEKIEKNETNTRPDIKGLISGIIGGVMVLLSAFSVILILTVDPLRNADTSAEVLNKEQTSLILEHAKILATTSAESKAQFIMVEREIEMANKFNNLRTIDVAKTFEMRLEHFKVWNGYLETYIERDLKKIMDNGERIAALEANVIANKSLISDIDRGGSRKWVPTPTIKYPAIKTTTK